MSKEKYLKYKNKYLELKNLKFNIHGGQKLYLSDYIREEIDGEYPSFFDEYFTNIIGYIQNRNGRELSKEEKRNVALHIYYEELMQISRSYPIQFFLTIGIFASAEMDDAFDIEIRLMNRQNFSPTNYQQMSELALSIYERYHSLNAAAPLNAAAHLNNNVASIGNNDLNAEYNYLRLNNLPRGYELTNEMRKRFSLESGGIGPAPRGNPMRKELLRDIYVNITKSTLQTERQKGKKEVLIREFKNSLKNNPAVFVKHYLSDYENANISENAKITNKNFNRIRQEQFTNKEISKIAKEPLRAKRMLKTFNANKITGEVGLQQMRNIENSQRKQKKILEEQKKKSKKNKNINNSNNSNINNK